MSWKRSKIVLLLMFFSLFFSFVLHAETAESIIKKSDYVLYGDSAECDIEITVYRGKEVKNSMNMFAKLKGSEKMVLFFTYPPKNKNNALLKEGDNLWMYFASRKRFLKIGARQLMGGSDFSYGDILNINLARDYEAKIVNESIDLNGNDCYKLELAAKRDNVTYDKIICFIRKGDFAPIKREFYTQSGELFKDMLFEDFEGARPMKFVMNNKLVDTNDYSTMIFSNLKLNVNIKDVYFTKNYIERGR